jgi:Domain of unknown function (DUF4351)
MTRIPHDQFAKNFLKDLVEGYGNAEVGYEVAAEVREIDFYFIPSPEMTESLAQLGVLGRILSGRCAIEVFRNPVPEAEINRCLNKRVDLQNDLERQAKREKQRLASAQRPHLWILTPSASSALLQTWQLSMKADWPAGIYFLPDPQRAALAVLDQLPVFPETLWLRMLGRDEVQRAAVAEFMALPPENPFKAVSLRHLMALQIHLRLRQDLRKLRKDEEEFVMNTAAVYEEWRQATLSEGRKEGRKEGEATLVIRQLRRRFQRITDEQETQIRQLSVEQLENLGEALLDLREVAELERWLQENPVTVQETGSV